MNLKIPKSTIGRAFKLLLITLVALLLMGWLVGAPAFEASRRLEILEKAEQSEQCQRRSPRLPARSVPASPQQQQQQTATETADGDQGGQGAYRVDDGGGCATSRANLIAIEVLRSSVASTFVAFVVGAATIIGVGAAVVAGRSATRVALSRVMLLPAVRSSTAGLELVLENGGEHPLWLIDVVVDVSALRCADDGLERIDPGRESVHSLSLASADGRGLRVSALFQDAFGFWRMDADLRRRSGIWQLDGFSNRARH